jgi:SAM-dependent methyltransferase
MVSAAVYDLMYRWWVPWDGVGVREDLRWLLDSGRVAPGARAVDLGCGSGANVVHLAEQGFDATGIDFSRVALDKARQRAEDAGVADRCRFLQADLTDPTADLGGPYDLLVDFGALDDLRPAGRRAMAATVKRLSRPGSHFLLWCFYAHAHELPRISFRGPSRMAPGLEPGEPAQLFGDAFDVETVHANRNGEPFACFLLTHRPTG